MIERVARALCAEACGRDADDIGGGFHPTGSQLDDGEPWWTGYIYQARAAIEAMREPAASMTAAGFEAMLTMGATPETVWHAMIGAAIKDGEV